MIVRPASDGDRAERERILQRVAALQEQGICPTCRNLDSGDVYPPADDRTFYDDGLAWCFLEAYPRNPGHTIILVKPHYEDLGQMPDAVGVRLVPVVRAAVGALEAVLGAEKVYLCTMCDGKRNHLHFQLIPRLPGDAVWASGLFVKERGVLAEYAEAVERLRREVSARLSGR